MTCRRFRRFGGDTPGRTRSRTGRGAVVTAGSVGGGTPSTVPGTAKPVPGSRADEHGRARLGRIGRAVLTKSSASSATKGDAIQRSSGACSIWSWCVASCSLWWLPWPIGQSWRSPRPLSPRANRRDFARSVAKVSGQRGTRRKAPSSMERRPIGARFARAAVHLRRSDPSCRSRVVLLGWLVSLDGPTRPLRIAAVGQSSIMRGSQSTMSGKAMQRARPKSWSATNGMMPR